MTKQTEKISADKLGTAAGEAKNSGEVNSSSKSSELLRKTKKKIKNTFQQHSPVPILRLATNIYGEWHGKKIPQQYIGKGVHCPCCDSEFSSFAVLKPFDGFNDINGFSVDKKAVCPRCNSAPRHRILCDFLNKQLAAQDASDKIINLSPGSRILIFAVSKAERNWFKRNKISYTSTDLFDRTADVKADIECLPFADNHFDFITCNHVLEHVGDFKIALKELHRVIKADGCVEISVPLDENLENTYEDASITTESGRFQAFAQSDHLRVFGMDFQSFLEDAGFNVTILDGDKCDPRIVPIIGPAKYDYNKLFLCTK